MTIAAVSTRTIAPRRGAPRRRPRFALFSALLIAFALLVPGFAVTAAASAAPPAAASQSAPAAAEQSAAESTDHLAKKKTKKKSKFGLIVAVIGVLIVLAVIALFLRRKRKR